MPAFFPCHVPPGLSPFARGYLAAAEWLLDEEDAARPVRGWSRAAIRRAIADCVDFRRENAAALAEYCASYSPRGGYDVEECAGHDFWLSRNGAGSGYFDRGDAPCFAALQAAARAYGEVWVYRGDTAWLHIG